MSASEQAHALLGVVLMLLLLMTWVAARKWWRSWRARRGGRHAHAREAAARELLQRAGFTVVGEQVRHVWAITCGDESWPIDYAPTISLNEGRVDSSPM